MSQHDSVQRAIDAIRRRDADAYAEVFAENATLQSPLSPAPLEGRAAIRESEQGLFDAFSDVEVEVVRLLSNERNAAAEVVLRATNTGPIHLGSGEPIPATGRRVELPSVWLFDFDSDGRITAERDYFDTAAFMALLGLDL